MKKNSYVFLVLVIAVIFAAPVHGQSEGAQIVLLDKGGNAVTKLVDGNQINLKIELGASVSADAQVDFLLDGVDAPLAACLIKSGQRSCASAAFSALGWRWDKGAIARAQRGIKARVNGQQATGSLNVSIVPRPVVMVHGFNADWHTWDSYLGPQGYLQSIGLHGYSVGDGQVPGVMDTGSLSAPQKRTKTIAQNAAILGEYINGVQQATGAEKVDLLVHSMGGMISRYYIDRLMVEVDVAQLIILGTPMAGSDCADLPAALGILLPATLEIQPTYMSGIFNQQIFRRRGVPFHALAGTKLLDSVTSPCTPVPSDVVVSVDSVKAIPMPVQEISLLHTNLNIVPQVFETFVKPLLQTPPGKFEVSVDPPAGSSAPVAQQFTKVYAGHLNAGETKDVAINIDSNVSVANFALYDTSRSLNISVRGASGNEIQLDAKKNGEIRIKDPSTLLYLGYGFAQPKPGKWLVTLQTTETTPPSGADYAIMAKFEGGAIFTAKIDNMIPKVNQPVNVTARLSIDGVEASIGGANATILKPDGGIENMEVEINGGNAALAIQPDQSGLYGIEVNITALSPDGFAVDRGAFLTFEAQPTQAIITFNRLLALGGIILLILAIRWLRSKRRRKIVTA